MAEGEGGQAKETKKRTRNPSEWKREKRKRLRVAGKSYINSKGDLVQERKIGEDCRCRRRCYTVVSEEQRHKLFDGYYSLNSHDEQNAYLFGLIRKHDIARKRHKDSDRRTCSYKYFVRIRGKEVQICRLAFAHIHGISPHKIRILCQKQDQNIMFPRDGRGRHENRPRKISEETLHQVRSHIYSIIRSDRVREFLKEEKHNGPDLNITKMWKDYLEKYDPNFYSLQFTNEKHHHLQLQAHMQHQHQQHQHQLHQQQQHEQQQMAGSPQDRISMQNFSGNHSHLGHHQVQHAQAHQHHGHPHHQSHTVAYPNMAQYQNMQVMTNGLGLVENQQQTHYSNHTVHNHNPHSGSGETDSQQQQQQQQQPSVPAQTQSPPAQQIKLEKTKGPKPIVKHWLYSKTFHDEFKFQDFLSLKKKLWMLKEEKTANPQIKTERKQKSPKKITRERELQMQVVSTNTNQSVVSVGTGQHQQQQQPQQQQQQQQQAQQQQAQQQQQQQSQQQTAAPAPTTTDMYILPVGLHELTQLPQQATDMLGQQPHHAMQLNLHTFSAQPGVLSPLINAQATTVTVPAQVTLPAATMSLAQNSCSYMNVNSAAFYQPFDCSIIQMVPQASL